MSSSSDPFNAQTMADKPGTEPPHDAPTLTNPTPEPRAAHPLLQRQFGAYELLDELGRGGMGVVYKARQAELDRVVALKMILSSHLANEVEVQRFHIEATAAARLRHKNIVAVHEVGVVDSQHFYSMEYIEGPSLARRISGAALPGQLAARYVMEIARAIHYAHSHGILHRDLKPSNILLDGDDTPHVTDFGLAKKLGDAGQTHTGAILGTPSYMAPEQAAGRTREIGPACDIYGLGAVLYELITGRPVFVGETALETIQHVLEDEPAAPQSVNPQVDHDLETICLKCLRKDPRLRYTSAAALADDLDRYLKGDTISARSFSMIDRLARTLDRSQNVGEFKSWGTMLVVFAAIMFVGHLAMFLILRTHQPRSMHWLARTAQLVLVGITFWHYRLRKSYFPMNAAERQLWGIWIGYFASYLITAIVVRELAGAETWDDRTLYPFSAVLSGMGFFAMGSSYWGRCYLFGLAFFGLAAMMPMLLDWAPLGLGFLWSAVLLIISRHVGKLAEAK